MPTITKRDIKGRFVENTIESFWSYINKTKSCWFWTGCLHPITGYGIFMIKRKKWLAHRFSFLLSGKKLNNNLTIDHLCHNKSCVNPNHLEQVSIQVNSQRRLVSKLNSSEVISIKKLHKKGYTQCELADLFGVGQPHISRVVNYRRWSNIIN